MNLFTICKQYIINKLGDILMRSNSVTFSGQTIGSEEFLTGWLRL